MLSEWFQRREAGAAALAAAIVLLAAFIALAGARERRRRRDWLVDPRQLLNSRTPSTAWSVLLALAASAVALASAMTSPNPLSPIATAVAALVCLGVGHAADLRAAREVGFALVGGVCVVSAISWWEASLAGAAIGALLAAVYSLWLAQFWHQQLAPEGAWTTTGRMIAPARRLALTWAICAAAALALLIRRGEWPIALGNLIVLALLAAALLAMAARDGRFRTAPPAPH